MPYTKTTWVDNVTAITAARLNHIESGIEDANVFVPIDDGLPGQVLTKNQSGAEWADAKPNIKIVGEILDYDSSADDQGGGDSSQEETIETLVYDWLEEHIDEISTIQDGEITQEKLAPSLTSEMVFKNDINKEFTLEATNLGKLDHTMLQIQGMATDGNLLYIAGTNGDTEPVVIYAANPAALLAPTEHWITDSSGNPIYGHPNSMDYCNGKLYITGCMPAAVEDDEVQGPTNYRYIYSVDVSSWETRKITLPAGVAWWSALMLRGYNGKYVLAGHRASSNKLELYATIYAGETDPLGKNKFVPWKEINIGAFSCDPAGMTQYKNYILIADAHLNSSVANNAIRVFTSDGDFKANIYLPATGTNEIEDICRIEDNLYVVDISGNVYVVDLTPVLRINYDPAMFTNNFGPGIQYCYINENGSETYTPLGDNTFVMTQFRVNPWFFPSKHWITGGSMLVRTGAGDQLNLRPTYTNNGDIVFSGTGKSVQALAYYFFRYTRSTNAPVEEDEYVYTLTTFGITAHYQGEEHVYNTIEEAKAAGYFNGYTYIRELICESMPRFTVTALEM